MIRRAASPKQRIDAGGEDRKEGEVEEMFEDVRGEQIGDCQAIRSKGRPLRERPHVGTAEHRQLRQCNGGGDGQQCERRRSKADQPPGRSRERLLDQNDGGQSDRTPVSG